EFRATEYITAITKCYPGKKGSRGDRVPTAAERKLCAPFLARELELVDPEIIVPVGRIAISRFLGKIGLDDAVGEVHERDGRLILPLPHPSGANLWLNRPESKELLKAALELLSELQNQ
ncbi:MAG TPA: uracil-DNA glycosylase, partial [Candidatus Acetothermia bacterium]|nr:uracil-DNA glycosylase [Candidatus Acetothermia bacterium]